MCIASRLFIATQPVGNCCHAPPLPTVDRFIYAFLNHGKKSRSLFLLCLVRFKQLLPWINWVICSDSFKIQRNRCESGTFQTNKAKRVCKRGKDRETVSSLWETLVNFHLYIYSVRAWKSAERRRKNLERYAINLSFIYYLLQVKYFSLQINLLCALSLRFHWALYSFTFS